MYLSTRFRIGSRFSDSRHSRYQFYKSRYHGTNCSTLFLPIVNQFTQLLNEWKWLNYEQFGLSSNDKDTFSNVIDIYINKLPISQSESELIELSSLISNEIESVKQGRRTNYDYYLSMKRL